METKDVILELRTKKGLSQDELAGLWKPAQTDWAFSIF